MRFFLFQPTTDVRQKRRRKVHSQSASYLCYTVPQCNLQMKATLQIKPGSFARMKAKTKALIRSGSFLSQCVMNQSILLNMVSHCRLVFWSIKLVRGLEQTITFAFVFNYVLEAFGYEENFGHSAVKNRFIWSSKCFSWNQERNHSAQEMRMKHLWQSIL